MIAGAVSDAHVSAELWLSFTSLLRAYGAIAGWAGSGFHVDELDEEDFRMVAGNSTLYVLYNVPTQRGEWSLVGSRGRQGGLLQLNLDGTMILEGATLEMDFAAIELVAKLTKSVGATR